MKQYISKALQLYKEEVIDQFNSAVYDWDVTPLSSAVLANNMAIVYLRAMVEIGEQMPYKSAKQMFAACKYPKEEYVLYKKRLRLERRFFQGDQLYLRKDDQVEIVRNQFFSQEDRQKLMKAAGIKYWENPDDIPAGIAESARNKDRHSGKYYYAKQALNYLKPCLSRQFDEVLANSETDPHMSAVSTNNSAVIFLCAMAEVGTPLHMNSTLKLFQYLGKTKEQCRVFKRWRKQERVYYGATQLILTRKGKVKRVCNIFESLQEPLELMEKAGIDISHRDIG